MTLSRNTTKIYNPISDNLDKQRAYKYIPTTVSKYEDLDQRCPYTQQSYDHK